MNEDKDLPRSRVRPSASTSADSSNRWSAASAGLADHPHPLLARTNSATSSAGSRLSGLSFASSSAGNRESVISNEAAEDYSMPQFTALGVRSAATLFFV